MSQNVWTEREIKRWMRPDAHRFLRPDWRRYWHPGYERDPLYKFYERVESKYRPDQLRDDLGRWTRETDSTVGNPHSIHEESPEVQEILARGKQIIAGAGGYHKCLNLCFPILERFQPFGSDRNTWDFHKCMNSCLGR